MKIQLEVVLCLYRRRLNVGCQEDSQLMQKRCVKYAPRNDIRSN